MLLIWVYIIFVFLIFITFMIMLYFFANSFRKYLYEKQFNRHCDNIKRQMDMQLQKDDPTDISSHDFHVIKSEVTDKNGLQAFTKVFSDYLTTGFDHDKLYQYAYMFIDLNILKVNRVVKEKYRDSYILYLLSLYKLTDQDTIDYALNMLDSKSAYTRNNALQVIKNSFIIGDVIIALEKIDACKHYFNDKVIIDFLINYQGEKTKLNSLLAINFNKFSINMKKNIIDYWTNISHTNSQIKKLLVNIIEGTNNLELELRISAIKYFSKHYDSELKQMFLTELDDSNWQIRAMTCITLGNYQDEDVMIALKNVMSDVNWFVRKNATYSLLKINTIFSDEELRNNPDEFARNIYIYATSKEQLIKQQVLVGEK